MAESTSFYLRLPSDLAPNRPGQLNQGYEFLPQYQGTKELGRVVRDLTAVVGAATVLVALADSQR